MIFNVGTSYICPKNGFNDPWLCTYASSQVVVLHSLKGNDIVINPKYDIHWEKTPFRNVMCIWQSLQFYATNTGGHHCFSASKIYRSLSDVAADFDLTKPSHMYRLIITKDELKPERMEESEWKKS